MLRGSESREAWVDPAAPQATQSDELAQLRNMARRLRADLDEARTERDRHWRKKRDAERTAAQLQRILGDA